MDPVTKEQKEEVLGTFEQYPVKLAWAITVHKSQGLTFDKAIIDVGRPSRRGRSTWRCRVLRSLDGLILRTRIDPSRGEHGPGCDGLQRAAHTQQPLPEQLKDQQQHYLQAVLTSTFDLGDLLKKVGASCRRTMRRWTSSRTRA